MQLLLVPGPCAVMQNLTTQVRTHLQTSQQDYSERKTCDLLLAMLDLMCAAFKSAQSGLKRCLEENNREPPPDPQRKASESQPCCIHGTNAKRNPMSLCLVLSLVLPACVLYIRLRRRVSPGPREFSAVALLGRVALQVSVSPSVQRGSAGSEA